MSQGNPQNQKSGYSFLGTSPAEELLIVARIHHKEAKQLYEHAQEALAEGRQEEAKLLMDLWAERRDMAEELDKAAREEVGDPIVAGLLESEDIMCKNYTPNSPTYTAPETDLPQSWKDEMKPRPLGPIARALAWIGSWVAD
jgi:acyl-CoA reductase-like NAD-dependent aldehyde dehydrogenase